MCTVDVPDGYQVFHSFTAPWAFTYADTREEHRDCQKRNRIRRVASPDFPDPPQDAVWGFLIHVKKSSRRRFDLENVPKLYVDAFSARQLQTDDSQYPGLACYQDDTIDHVKHITVSGERVAEKKSECTRVDILVRKGK